ncbi:MAG: exodeoxyribonuclease VII large subunit [Clostridia bacterium]|nr:exodeoxyribonuclease VII large subunit [Clostridia bacterium]
MKPEPITVTYLNKYIKEKVAEDEYLNNVYVKGEISNFKHHYTGHLYFTLKDESSLIKCIMFKSSTATLNFIPKEGMKVLVLGTVSVFERDGVYQIYVKAMKEDGIGDLYKEYEELKNKLEKEGFFDKKHKQKIPYMPKTIGVLTSQTGSVIKDIINVSTRRNPNVHIRLFPVPVQGKGAEIEIADAIRIMNEKKLADVLIIARGGGSIEDLWPFNEELTARAIYNSKIPIISAVGHETDFTISDFVADLRAPTPSAAAELAVPNIEEIKQKIDTYQNRYKILLKKKIEYMKLRYQKCIASKVFTDSTAKIKELYIELDNKIKKLENRMIDKIKDLKTSKIEIISKLDTLSPLKTLTRGYAIASKNEKNIKSVKEIKAEDIIDLKFIDGKVQTKVI